MGKKKGRRVIRIANPKRVFTLALCLVAVVAAGVLCACLYDADDVPKGDPTSLLSASPDTVEERRIRICFNTLYARAGETYTLSGESYNLDGTARDDVFVFSTSDAAVATVDDTGKITAVANGKCTITAAISGEPIFCLTAQVEVTDSARYYGGFTYIDGILIVNKYYKLPSTYNPGVSSEAKAAFNTMAAAASKDGLSLWIASGYRSYSYQQVLFAQNAARKGEEVANRSSARAGESEHQTGLAFDLNSLTQSFGNTPTGKWLAANAHKYGFILRFMNGKSDITGYIYEPWHFRYIGVEKATLVYESGLCLEEYLDIDF